MRTTTTPTRDNAQIHDRIDTLAQALRAKDIRTRCSEVREAC